MQCNAMSHGRYEQAACMKLMFMLTHAHVKWNRTLEFTPLHDSRGSEKKAPFEIALFVMLITHKPTVLTSPNETSAFNIWTIVGLLVWPFWASPGVPISHTCLSAHQIINVRSINSRPRNSILNHVPSGFGVKICHLCQIFQYVSAIKKLLK